MSSLKFYLNKCRFCFKNVKEKSFYPLHEYFEEMFNEATGIKVIKDEH